MHRILEMRLVKWSTWGAGGAFLIVGFGEGVFAGSEFNHLLGAVLSVCVLVSFILGFSAFFCGALSAEERSNVSGKLRMKKFSGMIVSLLLLGSGCWVLSGTVDINAAKKSAVVVGAALSGSGIIFIYLFSIGLDWRARK